MTLQEYRSAKHEQFFFAVVTRTLSWEEAKDVYIYPPEYPDGITAEEALNISIEQALLEDKKPVTEKNIKALEKEIKQKISTNIKESFYTIVLRRENLYIDISDMTEIKSDIEFLYPIGEYYKEGDYTFEENEEGDVYLKIDLEPFEQFVKDYREGKIN